MPRPRLLLAISAALLAAVLIHAQGTPPAAPLVLLTREGRRPIPTTIQSGQELIALDTVAALFDVTVREDTLAGGVTISYKGRTIVASVDQPMASVEGRLVALPSHAVRAGTTWLVPVEFLSRALGPIYERRIELRRPSRLLIVGDLRVPRVTARVETAGPLTRAVIDITPAAVATVSQEPTRVLVRIDADALDAALPVAGAGSVEQIRVSEQPTTVAVLLREAGAISAATTASDTATRVTIEVQAPGTQPPTVPPLEPPPTESIPALTSPRVALQTIVVDPGHGGADNGVAGPGGTLEKNVTLEVARRVKAVIETRLGIRVLLTRENDRSVDLNERAAIANNSKADVFISLHGNAAFAPGVSGAEVFHVASDPQIQQVRREAEAQSVTVPVLGGGTRTIDVVRWDMAQARHLEASAVLARTLEEALRERVPLGPRPRHEAPLRVLVSANMPAALVEMAYLTNPAQERRAASPEFQTAVAQAIYETVLRFRAYLEDRR